MSAKRSAAVAAAGLGLLLAVVLGIRHFGAPGAARTTTPPVTTRGSADPAQAPPDPSAGSVALRWVQLAGELHSRPPASPADEELARSRERELADQVKKGLSEDPSRWGDVLEVLCEEDPRIGRKIVGSLQDAVGDAAEGPLLRLLKDGRHRETRMSAATLVGSRGSNESLWGLISASQQDPDSGVRHQALSELLKRQGRASPAEATAIDQTIRLRAQVDPDPSIRQFALRATGQAAEPPPRPPPPPPPRAPRKAIDAGAPRK